MHPHAVGTDEVCVGVLNGEIVDGLAPAGEADRPGYGFAGGRAERGP
jgi:hypothetical protein